MPMYNRIHYKVGFHSGRTSSTRLPPQALAGTNKHANGTLRSRRAWAVSHPLNCREGLVICYATTLCPIVNHIQYLIVSCGVLVFKVGREATVHPLLYHLETEFYCLHKKGSKAFRYHLQLSGPFSLLERIHITSEDDRYHSQQENL